jgi:glutaredoxin-like protein
MTVMLDEKIREQVRDLFKNLRHPVTICLFVSSKPERCEYCRETESLLKEVCELSGLLRVEVHDFEQDAELAAQYKVDGVPEFVLLRQEGEQEIDYGIRFKGIPSGYEFSSLVNSLVLVSQGESNLSQESRRFLGELASPVHLQVFVTPT